MRIMYKENGMELGINSGTRVLGIGMAIGLAWAMDRMIACWLDLEALAWRVMFALLP